MQRWEEFSVGSRPVPEIAEAGTNFAREQGYGIPEADYSRIVMPRRATLRVGEGYDRLPSFQEGAEPAFRQMAEETSRQFDLMTRPPSRGGLGISVDVTDHEPYGADDINNAMSEFRNDVVNNRHISVLSSRSTGGHPYFTNDQNDMFRAVHDVFGHLGSGRGVDAHGEEAAFQKHARMFSPLARQAMTTETRGQNSSLHLHQGQFQPQKIAILPRGLRRLDLSRPAFPEEADAARRDAFNENLKQGLL